MDSICLQNIISQHIAHVIFTSKNDESFIIHYSTYAIETFTYLETYWAQITAILASDWWRTIICCKSVQTYINDIVIISIHPDMRHSSLLIQYHITHIHIIAFIISTQFITLIQDYMYLHLSHCLCHHNDMSANISWLAADHLQITSNHSSIENHFSHNIFNIQYNRI